jgi:hypothetical protein
MLGAPVFAISPFLLALMLFPFVGGSNESEGVGALPWLVFLTAPLSVVVFIIGVVLALTGRKRSITA